MRDKCARLARTCEKPGSQWSQSVPSRGRCAAPGASSRSLLCATSAYSVSLWCVFAASFSPQRHRVRRGCTEKKFKLSTRLTIAIVVRAVRNNRQVNLIRRLPLRELLLAGVVRRAAEVSMPSTIEISPAVMETLGTVQPHWCL